MRLSSLCGYLPWACCLLSCGQGYVFPHADYVTDWGHVSVSLKGNDYPHDEVQFGLQTIAALVRDSNPKEYPRGLIKQGLEYYKPHVVFHNGPVHCHSGSCMGTTRTDIDRIDLFGLRLENQDDHQCLAGTAFGHEFIHYIRGIREEELDPNHEDERYFRAEDSVEVRWQQIVAEEFCNEWF